jgi:tetratricopeptide (TPR) repeat protein
MKAERRHELQTNTLSQFITDLPYYVRFHANKILVGVIVICALILLYRYRTRAVEEGRAATKSSLTAARSGIDQLQMLDRIQTDDMARAQDRKKFATQVNAAVDEILQNTKDSEDASLRAEALVARGDLNWVLANLPPLASATTQPMLALPQSSSEYLENAAGAYQQVLKNYNSNMIAKASALLGLGAIEENRGNWDKATEDYNQLTSDPAMASAFKEVARQHLAMIPQLRVPVYLGSYSSTQPSSQPTTEPFTAAPNLKK